MFLFLPSIYKEKVKREYNIRLWASVCIMLGCVTLASSALVFPAYLRAQSAHISAAAEYAVAANAAASLHDQNADTAISNTKAYMAAFQTLVPLDADAIAASVLSAKQSGVSITSVSIGNTSSGVSVSVGGVAGTRDELIAFSHALQNAANFSAVTLPVDDLAKDTDISYTISFSVNSPSQ